MTVRRGFAEKVVVETFLIGVRPQTFNDETPSPFEVTKNQAIDIWDGLTKHLDLGALRKVRCGNPNPHEKHFVDDGSWCAGYPRGMA